MQKRLFLCKKNRDETMENTMRKPEPYSAEVIDEVIVRFSNDGYSPKPTQEMILSTDKSNCKSDYGCCGHL